MNSTEKPIDRISATESTIEVHPTTPESLPVGLDKIENISDNIDMPNSDHMTEVKESADNEKNVNEEETIEEKSQDPTSETITEAEDDLKEIHPETKICCEYMDYLNKSPVEQQNYVDTFSSPMAFIEWCKAAEAEHKNHQTVIEAIGGELNIGDIIQ